MNLYDAILFLFLFSLKVTCFCLHFFFNEGKSHQLFNGIEQEVQECIV